MYIINRFILKLNNSIIFILCEEYKQILLLARNGYAHIKHTLNISLITLS